jgi:hypothetical protein
VYVCRTPKFITWIYLDCRSLLDYDAVSVANTYQRLGTSCRLHPQDTPSTYSRLWEPLILNKFIIFWWRFQWKRWFVRKCWSYELPHYVVLQVHSNVSDRHTVFRAALKREIVRSTETSVYTYYSTWRYKSEDLCPTSSACENFRSHKLLSSNKTLKKKYDMTFRYLSIPP